MNKEEAFKIGLPKWPQCVINGDKITEEQALEIIRRTDEFFIFLSYNTFEIGVKSRQICRYPERSNFIDEDEYYEAVDKFREDWGMIETECIFNAWIDSYWVGGYHGWCHPDGTIAYCNNIGKYPSVEEVYNDLCILGKNFPFLSFNCTLTNGEEDYCDTSLVTMKLINGKVEFIDTIPFEKLEFNGIKDGFRPGKRGCIGLDQIQKWADTVYGVTN